MPTLPVEYFELLEDTGLGSVVRESLWLFPVIEAVHLLGLCLLGGALLIVDLRLFGWGLKERAISELARDARWWMIGGVAVMIATGVPLFLSEAVKCYYNTSFWVKMVTFPLALGFTFGLRELVVIRNEGLETSFRTRLLGAGNMALWFVVAAAGRWIGFS